MSHAKNPSVEACRSLFGEHPEDVITPINSATEALCWLEELFKTIEQEALNERSGYRIKHLAEMGAYLACNMSDFTGSQYETMMGSLRTALAVSAEGEPA